MEIFQKNYCTLEYAEAVLPQLKRIIKRVVGVNKTLEYMSSIEISYEDLYSEMRNNLKFNRKFFKLSHELYKLLDYLLDRGIVVRDIETGLIDIYSLYENREIFLCWRLGEDSIRFWHEINSGYKDRKPISLLRYKA
ncbi:DUF2203 domain-containing protein [Candidatus Woesearchaeota archaeon]|nr:DUF2203 domain-containing protein [Candidatus Woesearchaeota archaeon]